MSEPVPYEPAPADLIRVGDAERQQAVTALGEHFAAGRLDQPEFDTRVQRAYAARTAVDLRGLFVDLPEPAPFRPAAPAGFGAGRAARDRRRPVPSPFLPVLIVLMVLAVVVSARFHVPVFPFVLLLWFGVGRRWHARA